jgi:Transposase domain (DUF772)
MIVTDWTGLFSVDNGRPAADPVLLGGVTLLQFMEKVADRGASEHVVYYLGWKYALDLELDYGVSLFSRPVGREKGRAGDL